MVYVAPILSRVINRMLWPCFPLSRALSLTLFCASLVAPAFAAQSLQEESTEPETIRGSVINSVTHEPIPRALVFSPDRRLATLTDDRGRFEFKLQPAQSGSHSGTDLGISHSLGGSQNQLLTPLVPNSFHAQKPGFLLDESAFGTRPTVSPGQEITLTLIPEALIVGQVNLPTSDASDIIQVELYRRAISEGRQTWVLAGSTSTRSNGEFRFADLPAGEYRLFTRELLDRDPLTFNPTAQLFGYPPVYYPASRDFATASPILVTPGTTSYANFSPTRREYYPVRIPVSNASLGAAIEVRVWPQGHPGPGYSLGYDNSQQLIEGLLPNGNFTLQISTSEPNAATGLLNFSVSGPSTEVSSVNLIPNSSAKVSVKLELGSEESLSALNAATQDQGSASAKHQLLQSSSVSLIPENASPGDANGETRAPTGMDEDSVLFQNVPPGRYWVRVRPGIGYAASINSGGSDLLRNPLVVGFGGSIPPIEVTLRDDGATLDGSIEDLANQQRQPQSNPLVSPVGLVYLIPQSGSVGQYREATLAAEGTFALSQVPPGVYRVLAMEGPHLELEYTNAEAMRKFESLGQLVRLVAAQSEHLRLHIIPGSD
jgi:hypothetical protein